MAIMRRLITFHQLKLKVNSMFEYDRDDCLEQHIDISESYIKNIVLYWKRKKSQEKKEKIYSLIRELKNATR